MGGHDHREPTGARRTMELAALASRSCPSPDAALVAVAGAFRPCDDAAVDRELDALALPLFGLEGEPEKVGPALAELFARRFEADLWPLDGLWIDHVLAGGVGHPLVLAAIGAEVARRAGAPAVVCSSRGTWYAGLPGPEHMWLVEPACAAARRPAVPARALRARARPRGPDPDRRALRPRRGRRGGRARARAARDHRRR